MPVYEYKCRRCELRFDRYVPFDVKVCLCPKCDPIAMADKQIAAPAFTVTGYNAKNGYSRQ